MAQEKDVSRLVLELSADVAKLSSGLQRGQRISEQRTAAIARAYDQMEKRTSRSTSIMGMNIQRVIGGLALAAAAREVQQYADTWTRATNQLLAAGNSQEQAGAKLNELTDIALRSRSSLEGTITLYNRLIATSGDLGVSQQRVARVVETVNKALATSNMTAGERQSAITQLSQGLGSGTLAGDELKAIRENSQALSQAIATEFGVSIGELKKLGEEGKLTSAKVFAALENATANVETAFSKTRATIDDSFTNLQTKTTQYIGQMDAATGASEKLAAVIAFTADHIDEIATAAGLAAVVVGAGYATAMTVAAARTGMATISLIAYQVALIRLQARQTGATVAQIALNAAMTANPIGLVIVAVAALAGGLYLLSQRASEAEKTTAKMDAAISEADKALRDYEAAALKARDATGENAKAAREAAAANREETVTIIQKTRALANEALSKAQTKLTESQQAYQAAISTAPGREFGEVAGQLALAASAQKQYQDASVAAASAVREQIRVEQEAERIRQGINLGGMGARPGAAEAPKAGKDKKDSGPTPEELAATRTMLALEARLNLLRAQGREADADQVQAQIDTIRLTKELTDAKVADAAAVAKAQIDAVRNAEAMTRGRENALEQTKFFLDAAKEALVAYNEEQDRQLQLQIDIARLEGNDTVVRMLERELRLRQAINALGPNALPEQVATVRRDNTRLTDSEDAARYREKGQDMAQSFISIIRADDIGTEIGNRFREAAFDKLQDVIGNLFGQLMQAGAGGGGSGGWIGTAARLFGGGRALGGPVKAGMTYKINETTPRSEYFTPAQNGYVGNMPKAKGQPVRQNVTIRQGDLYLAGANGDAVIYSNVRRMMDQNRRQTLADVKAGAPAAQLEQQLLRS
jgi:tape measure domain-containing protein